VLLVDDDPSIRRLLAAIVAAAGFVCDVAGDLTEARERLTGFGPDIVLLDLDLGGEPGSCWSRRSPHAQTPRRC
jgi:two-component system OmpR family response regulator